VIDDDNADIYEDISFEYRMSDGRCLTETPRLYSSVKEYAFFVRDGRFSSIATASAHFQTVRLQMAIAHALTLRNIPSYAHLQPADIDELVQELRFGLDGILKAAERVEAFIKALASDPTARAERYKGFPVARTPQGRSKNMIDSAQLMTLCHLPDSAKMLPRVAWLTADAAVRYGMSPGSKGERPSTLPALENVTCQQLQRSLDCLQVLYSMRNFVKCEAPQAPPFPQGVMKVANAYGVKSKPTPVPPPMLTLHLLEASTKLIGQDARYILDVLERTDSSSVREGEQALFRFRDAFPAEFAQSLRVLSREKQLLRLVAMLITACWVIIAAFTARRYEETLALDEASLRGSDEEGWWLHCHISKTTRSKEWLPVPIIVARSFNLLCLISAPARANGASSLYSWIMPTGLGRAKVREISPRLSLNDLASAVGTPMHSIDGIDSDWHWIPRQFRRFFAVLYFYRFEGADIAILSYFLRHFDIETTRGYLTHDPEAAKFFREVEKDYVRRLADSIADGERVVGGAMGERLKKITKLIKSKLRKHLMVTSSVGEQLYNVIERGGLVITPKPWTTCTCPRTQLAAKKARCRAGQVITDDTLGPSFADAGPLVCSICKWALLEPAKSKYAVRTEVTLEAAVASGCREGTLFGDLERDNLIELQKLSSGMFGVSNPANNPTDKPNG
jgi:hypothetical protein